MEKFKVEVSPATAHQSATPANMRKQLANDATQPQQDGTIPDAQFRASMEKIFTERAPVFEALAQSERDDKQAS